MLREHNRKQLPMSPKWAIYTPDGKGRDEYIRFDNGGLHSKIYKLKTKPNYDIFDNKKYYNTKKNLASFKYHSDGTGRDSYVVHESGGLERNYKTLNSYHLVDFLRKKDYKPCNPILLENKKKEGENIEQFFMTNKEQKHDQRLKSLQSDLINRLYNTETHKFINNEEKKK